MQYRWRILSLSLLVISPSTACDQSTEEPRDTPATAAAGEGEAAPSVTTLLEYLDSSAGDEERRGQMTHVYIYPDGDELEWYLLPYEYTTDDECLAPTRREQDQIFALNPVPVEVGTHELDPEGMGFVVNPGPGGSYPKEVRGSIQIDSVTEREVVGRMNVRLHDDDDEVGRVEGPFRAMRMRCED